MWVLYTRFDVSHAVDRVIALPAIQSTEARTLDLDANRLGACVDYFVVTDIVRSRLRKSDHVLLDCFECSRQHATRKVCSGDISGER